MNGLVTMFQDGGPVMYVVLAGAFVLPLLAVFATIAQVARWRFPNVLLLCVPLSVAVFGLIGTYIGADLAMQAVASATPSFIDRMAAAGYAVAANTTVFGAAAGAFGCALLAAGNAFGIAIRPGEKPEFTPIPMVSGMLFGLICVPLSAWFAGWVTAGITVILAFAYTIGALRFPYEKDADRARVVTARVLNGFYGLWAYALLLVMLYAYGQSQFHGAGANAAPEMVAGLQAAAIGALPQALGVTALLGVASMLLGLLQASSKLGDVDGRGWAQGVAFVLPVLVMLPAVGGVAWKLNSLAEQAIPWAEMRKPVLKANDVRTPLLDLDPLEPLARADTMQFGGTVTWNDGAIPAGLTPGEQVNLEAGPDTALSEVAAQVGIIETANLCLTVRSNGLLSCMPFRMASSEAAESNKSLMVEAVSPDVQLVPQDRGWVLMKDADTILGRGDLDEIAKVVPPSPVEVRVWFLPGLTVEDLVDVQRRLSAGRTELPLVLWRTDEPPKAPEAATGDGTMTAEGVDREAVREVVQRYASQIGYCHDRALQNRPDTHGAFNVRFTIGSAGTVVDTKVRDSTINDSEIERCVETRIRNMRFPVPAKGEASVLYPFVFEKPDASPP